MDQDFRTLTQSSLLLQHKWWSVLCCFLLLHGTHSHNFKLSRSISTTRQGNKNVYLFGFVSFSIGSSVRRLRHSYEFSGDNKYVDFLLQKTKKNFRVFSCRRPAFCVVVIADSRARGKEKKTLKIPFIFKQRPRIQQPPRMTLKEEGTSRLWILLRMVAAASHCCHFRVLHQDGSLLLEAKGNRGRLEV